MAKSLKSLLSKINLVDLAVVLVLIAVMVCLMKKMNVVEGLCLGRSESDNDRCGTFNTMNSCNENDRCDWNTCIINFDFINYVGLTEWLDGAQLQERVRNICKGEERDNTCGQGGIDGAYLLAGACCIEDPENPGECSN